MTRDYLAVYRKLVGEPPPATLGFMPARSNCLGRPAVVQASGLLGPVGWECRTQGVGT